MARPLKAIENGYFWAFTISGRASRMWVAARPRTLKTPAAGTSKSITKRGFWAKPGKQAHFSPCWAKSDQKKSRQALFGKMT
jgi:hypothetical protein